MLYTEDGWVIPTSWVPPRRDRSAHFDWKYMDPRVKHEENLWECGFSKLRASILDRLMVKLSLNRYIPTQYHILMEELLLPCYFDFESRDCMCMEFNAHDSRIFLVAPLTSHLVS